MSTTTTPTKEPLEMDDSNSTTPNSTKGRLSLVNTPKAGSVWESRMKLDQVKGGIKSLIATHDDHNLQNPPIPANSQQQTTLTINPEIDKKVNNKQSPSGKRKTWKSESTPVQIARQQKPHDDGIKKSPSVIKKTRSSVVVGRGNSVQLIRKVKSESIQDCDDRDDRVEIVNNSRSDNEDELVVADSNVGGDKKVLSDYDTDFDEIDGKEIEVVKKSVVDDVKEINVVEKSSLKKIVVAEKKLVFSNENKIAVSSIVKKQAPVSTHVNIAKVHPIPTNVKPENGSHGIPRANGKLQSFVDLVMWRDVSKSAFVFGIGTFFIISSSYTKDINISFISVVSYLGLVYLAAIFLFRSLITRGSIDRDCTNQDYVVGEEEAIWLVKLFLPYANEFLLKLRALFSGDPSTTMKLAVLLFVLARCGSSITIWKMAKLGFIGVFTVPKVCSSYSSQLTAYGTFWIRRFRDAWDSCSHKKAVGFAIFTLVWNLSSVVARIWAVFMLFVAFKYYQHSMIREGWAQEEEHRTDNASNNGGPRGVGRRSTLTDIRKQKKIY